MFSKVRSNIDYQFKHIINNGNLVKKIIRHNIPRTLNSIFKNSDRLPILLLVPRIINYKNQVSVPRRCPYLTGIKISAVDLIIRIDLPTKNIFVKIN